MTPHRESEVAAHGFYWEEGLHFPLTKKETTALVAAALEEDDAKHDITTAATVLSDRRARCRLVAIAIICGKPGHRREVRRAAATRHLRRHSTGHLKEARLEV